MQLLSLRYNPGTKSYEYIVDTQEKYVAGLLDSSGALLTSSELEQTTAALSGLRAGDYRLVVGKVKDGDLVIEDYADFSVQGTGYSWLLPFVILGMILLGMYLIHVAGKDSINTSLT